jgi:ribosomal protein S6--L-glutamate ligase
LKILVLYGSKPSKNSEELIEAAQNMGHTMYAGPTCDMSSMISNDGSQFWLGREDVSDVDLCLLRSFGPGSTEQSTRRISMLEHMELAGIKMVNSTYPFRRSRDKYATQYILHSAGIPIPQTYTTESLARAYQQTNEMGEIIYKPILGSMGRGSMKFDDADLAYNAYRLLDRLHHPLILQKYIETPGRDIRVFIVGDEVVGAVYKYLPEGEWKSNVAQGGRMVEEEMSEEIIDMAFSATEIMGLDYAGVDILESPEGPVVLEMNASPGWQGLKKATGKDVAEVIVRYGVEQVE